MARFASEAELGTFLGRLDPDYFQFASTLWQNGVKTARQLVNATKPLLLSYGLPELYIDDIKAEANKTDTDADKDGGTKEVVARLLREVDQLKSAGLAAARTDREAGQTEKRRKMREDLEKRDSTWQTARNDEQKARNRLKEELDSLRRQAAERASHAAEVSLAFAQATAQPPQSTDHHNPAAPAEYQPEAPPYMTEELLRTLKVSWDKQNSATYSTDDLRQIMSKHGPVEDVILQDSKKRKKGSALIVMQDLQSARAAGEAVNGSLSNPLLVVPFAKAAARSGADSSAPPQAEQAPSPEAYMPAEPAQQP